MRFLTAERVFDGTQYLNAGTVLVLNDQNVLSDILPSGTIENNRIFNAGDLLTPGFVNAHCHLELSHLKGKISQGTGLPAFAKELMVKRNTCSAEEIQEFIKDADLEMKNNGIVLVGDICNTTDTLKQKMLSALRYHSYVELIGLQPLQATNIFEKGTEVLNSFFLEGLATSFAPHAPYSVSTDLIEKICAFNSQKGLPISIHNEESNAEIDFLMGKGGGIKGLYEFLKLDISYFDAPIKTSLAYLGKKISSRPRTFVHNTFSVQQDIAEQSDENTYWCFCPQANLYIEKKLPDFTRFKGRNICLGTDSLASNFGLNLIDEINVILDNSNTFSVEELLKAATSGGAASLGLQATYGKLKPGLNAGINLLNTNNNTLRFIKKIC